MPVKQSLRSQSDLKKITSDKKQVTSKSKTVVNAETKVATPKVAATSTMKKTTADGFSIPVYSLAGKETGTLSLPKEVFGKTVNKKLLSQALRVYLSNKKVHTASTKTRGKVQGSTAKVWRQKGTGRARHGARTAPIFVGGGITFGPQFKDIKLDLPKKMRKAALLNALSSKLSDKDIFGITGLDKATGKTKEVAALAKNLKLKSSLIITGDKMDNVVRGAKNIPGIDVTSVNLLNAYEVLRHGKVLITKEAVEMLGESQHKEVKETNK